MKYSPGNKVRPIYKKALIAAIVIYAVANCYFLSSLICRVGVIEHHMEHVH